MRPRSPRGGSGRSEAGIARREYRFTQQGDGEPSPWTELEVGRSFNVTSEGVTTVEARVADEAGRQAAAGETVKIDRSTPHVEELLVGEPDPTSGDVDIEIVAGDGDPGERDPTSADDWDAAQSGVEGVELLIDGQRVTPDHYVFQACEGDGIDGNGDPQLELPWGSCKLGTRFTVTPAQATPGENDLEVLAVDAVGNERRVSITADFAGANPFELVDEIASFGLLAPLAEDDHAREPSLTDDTDGFDLTDAVVDGTIARDPAEGFGLSIDDAVVVFTPVEVAVDADEGQQVTDQAVLFEGTADDVDTVVEVDTEGVRSSAQVQTPTAPESTWEVEVVTGEAFALEEDEDSVALTIDATPDDPDASPTVIDISVSGATDASGNEVPADIDLDSEGRQITVAASELEGVQFPVSLETGFELAESFVSSSDTMVMIDDDGEAHEVLRDDEDIPGDTFGLMGQPATAQSGIRVGSWGCNIGGPHRPIRLSSHSRRMHSYGTATCGSVLRSPYVKSVRVKACIEHKAKILFVTHWPDDACKTASKPARSVMRVHQTVTADCKGKTYRSSNKLTIDRRPFIIPDVNTIWKSRGRTSC